MKLIHPWFHFSWNCPICTVHFFCHDRTYNVCVFYRYFWYNDALGASDDIGRAASFNWKLFLCLLLAWVVVYLCLFRGIKSAGKVSCAADSINIQLEVNECYTPISIHLQYWPVTGECFTTKIFCQCKHSSPEPHLANGLINQFDSTLLAIHICIS